MEEWSSGGTAMTCVRSRSRPARATRQMDPVKRQRNVESDGRLFSLRIARARASCAREAKCYGFAPTSRHCWREKVA